MSDEATGEGIVAFAENYRLAGLAVLLARREDMALHAPSRFLFKHCIELCFKAYLTKAGVAEKVLRDEYGHQSVRLAHFALSKGMVMDQYDLSIILDFLALENPMDDRYLRVGGRTELKPEVLAQIAERLVLATRDNIAALEMMRQVELPPAPPGP